MIRRKHIVALDSIFLVDAFDFFSFFDFGILCLKWNSRCFAFFVFDRNGHEGQTSRLSKYFSDLEGIALSGYMTVEADWHCTKYVIKCSVPSFDVASKCFPWCVTMKSKTYKNENILLKTAILQNILLIRHNKNILKNLCISCLPCGIKKT